MVKSFQEWIRENEVPTNNIGAGKVAGLNGDPVVKKKPKAKKTLRGVISAVNMK